MHGTVSETRCHLWVSVTSVPRTGVTGLYTEFVPKGQSHKNFSALFLSVSCSKMGRNSSQRLTWVTSSPHHVCILRHTNEHRMPLGSPLFKAQRPWHLPVSYTASPPPLWTWNLSAAWKHEDDLYGVSRRSPSWGCMQFLEKTDVLLSCKSYGHHCKRTSVIVYFQYVNSTEAPGLRISRQH